MKKVMIILAVAALSCHTANAQLGRLVRKAAEKAVEKTTDKIVDKTAEAASDAVVNATGGKSTKTDAKTTNAKADSHLKVYKKVEADRTLSQMISLMGNDRVEEIAKMLSADKVTDSALATARELMNG